MLRQLTPHSPAKGNCSTHEHRCVRLADCPAAPCAQGDVLEVSAGTARNLPFYAPRQLTSLTLTDSSRGMLFFARKKAAKQPQGVPVAVHQSDARCLVANPCIGLGDAAQTAATVDASAGAEVDNKRKPAAAAPQLAGPATARASTWFGDRAAPAAAAGPQAATPSASTDPSAGVTERPAVVEVAAPPREGMNAGALVPALRVFEPGTFSTVVDTFGLCSHSDPVGTLRVGPPMFGFRFRFTCP